MVFVFSGSPPDTESDSISLGVESSLKLFLGNLIAKHSWQLNLTLRVAGENAVLAFCFLVEDITNIERYFKSISLA